MYLQPPTASRDAIEQDHRYLMDAIRTYQFAYLLYAGDRLRDSNYGGKLDWTEGEKSDYNRKGTDPGTDQKMSI